MKNSRAKNVMIFASNAFFHFRFNRTLIDTLIENRIAVYLVYDFKFNKSNFDEEFKSYCLKNKIKIFNVNVPRNLFKVHDLLISFIQTLRLFIEIKPDIVHTHTPVISAVVRICSIFFKHEVIYTAHGMHFYYRKDYLVGRHFYYIEKLLSKITDKLCLINVDDYMICKKSFYCDVYYIPGIGVDTFEFAKPMLSDDKPKIKFLSVGELNTNKNHLLIINAMHEMKFDFIYNIIGEGLELKKLKKTINKLSLQSKVKLVGYVEDVDPYFKNADVFIHPSKREGLPVSLMEAMSYQLPILSSDIRGCRDLIEEKKGGFFFDPLSVFSFKTSLKRILSSRNKWLKMGQFNQIKLTNFSKSVVREKYLNLYHLDGKNNE